MLGKPADVDNNSGSFAILRISVANVPDVQHSDLASMVSVYHKKGLCCSSLAKPARLSNSGDSDSRKIKITFTGRAAFALRFYTDGE